MSQYDGWRDYDPRSPRSEAVKPKRQSRGQRMNATPTIVTADLLTMPADVAKATGVVGTRFASHKEAVEWVRLKLLQKAGEVFNVQRQVPFALHVVGQEGRPVMIGKIVIDFTYVTAEGTFTLLEIKGQPRREGLYIWKKRHYEAEYGVPITEG